MKAEHLAKLFFEALEIDTFEHGVRTIPTRKWEELPEGPKRMLTAACIEVLQKWQPGQAA